MLDSVGLQLTEQADRLSAKQLVPVTCVSDDLNRGGTWEVCGNKSMINHLEKERVEKRQWSTIYIQSTTDGTTVDPVQCNIGGNLRHGVEDNMDFPEHPHSLFNWCKLIEARHTVSFEKILAHTITHNLQLPHYYYPPKSRHFDYKSKYKVPCAVLTNENKNDRISYLPSFEWYHTWWHFVFSI